MNKKTNSSKTLSGRVLKIAIRVIGIFSLILLTMIGVFWFIFENKKDWILDEIELYVNKNNSGELEIENIEFLPLKYFPKAGFTLNQIKYYESKDSLKKKNEPPFFMAEKIDANLDLWPLVKFSKLKVDNINLREVSLYIRNSKNDKLSFSDALIILKGKIENQIEEFGIDLLNLHSDKEDDILPDISFNVNQFLYKNKRYENIKHVEVIGKLYETTNNIHLDFSKFDVEMPSGDLNVTAIISINDKNELKIKTQLLMNEFAYNYIVDPIDEIVPYFDPKDKKWDLDSLTKFNLNLKLSTLIKFEPFQIKNVNIENGKLEIMPVVSERVVFDSISLKATDISFIRKKKSQVIIGLKSIGGEMEIGKLDMPPFGESSVEMSFEGQNNSINLVFDWNNDVFVTEEANVSLDFGAKEKSYSIHLYAKEIDMGRMIQTNDTGRVSKGKVDLLLDAQTTGLEIDNLINNIDGEIKFSSQELILYGMDIDALLKTYERSQKFNLVDVSAFLFAGPMGALTTKGSDLLKLSQSKLKEGDSTYISNFIADLNISKGKLNTKDVAMATLKNRIAILGTIDLLNDTIPNLTVAVLDKNGCGKIEQKFYGRTDSIQLAKVKTLQVVFGSVKNAVNSVFGKKCKPVYNGVIKHPVTK